MGSSKWGDKSPNMCYTYSYPTYKLPLKLQLGPKPYTLVEPLIPFKEPLREPLITTHEPPSRGLEFRLWGWGFGCEPKTKAVPTLLPLNGKASSRVGG